MMIVKIAVAIGAAIVPAYHFYKNRLWRRSRTFDSF